MKSCLTSLIDSYDEVTGSVDEGRAVDVVYLLFLKVLDTISHNFLTDKQTVRCIDNWLRVTERWHRLARKVVSMLEDSQKQSGCCPGKMTLGGPA